MKIEAIIFDFFGVICTEVAPRWFRSYFPEDEARKLKNQHFGPVDRGETIYDQLLNQLGKLVNKPPLVVGDEFNQLTQVDGRIIDLIRRLKSHYKIGLCSNSARDFIRPILESNQLTGLFDATVISSERGVVKPKPEIFEIVLRELGVKPEQAIFIDDSAVNVEAANRLGLTGILFTNLPDLRNRLTKLGCLSPASAQ